MQYYKFVTVILVTFPHHISISFTNMNLDGD